MFNKLSEKLTGSLFGLKGKTTITEEAIQNTLREIRLALLEADVNFKVVKDFIEAVKVKSLGSEVTQGIKSGDEFTKIVHDELVNVLGKSEEKIDFNRSFTTIMMVGLQGSGKTTTTGKIARLVSGKEKKKVLLVAADIYRPAAIDQLVTIGKQIGVEVFQKGTQDPRVTVKEAKEYAIANNFDVMIVDTAGRLHIDSELMTELADVKQIINPNEILLVVDAMTGQDIINVAQGFNDQLSLTGCVITKLDGDARGGAALSIRYMLNVPIKFIGTGEKLDQIDYFYPSRMADRILGMGDVVSLVEKARDVIDEKEMSKVANKMMKGEFDLDDLLAQLQNVKKMGSSKMLALIPGIPKMSQEQMDAAEAQIKLFETLIRSMTLEERRKPKLLKDANRKNRIIKGSGRSAQDFNKLVSQWEQMSKMMQMLKGGKNPLAGMGGLGGLGGLGGFR